MRSLDILSSLIKPGNVATLIPGHGDYTTDRIEMEQRLSDSIDYLNRLKLHIDGKTTFDFASYVKRYSFPKVMGKFHAGNLKLVGEEVNG